MKTHHQPFYMLDKSAIVTLVNLPPKFTISLVLQFASSYGTVVALDCSQNLYITGNVYVAFQYRSHASLAASQLDGLVILDHRMTAQIDGALPPIDPSINSSEVTNDERVQPRNLYVLNLAFDIDNQKLCDIFSQCGEVVHVCILATVDSAGRRRAFVDFASSVAAKKAISTFNGLVVQGYRMDVSYAIVQRSGVTSPSINGNGNRNDKLVPYGQGWNEYPRKPSKPPLLNNKPVTKYEKLNDLVDTANFRTLVVQNLSHNVQSDQDLQHLFYIFGSIEECHIQVNVLDNKPTGSGYVVFSTHREANIAHETITANNTSLCTNLVSKLVHTDSINHIHLQFAGKQTSDIFFPFIMDTATSDKNNSRKTSDSSLVSVSSIMLSSDDKEQSGSVSPTLSSLFESEDWPSAILKTETKFSRLALK